MLVMHGFPWSPFCAPMQPRDSATRFRNVKPIPNSPAFPTCIADHHTRTQQRAAGPNPLPPTSELIGFPTSHLPGCSTLQRHQPIRTFLTNKSQHGGGGPGGDGTSGTLPKQWKFIGILKESSHVGFPWFCMVSISRPDATARHRDSLQERHDLRLANLSNSHRRSPQPGPATRRLSKLPTSVTIQPPQLPNSPFARPSNSSTSPTHPHLHSTSTRNRGRGPDGGDASGDLAKTEESHWYSEGK